jgi:alkanesulfonate monooxygenase SsuD/methylene tetrahydromethanopterin reductase-like flavin-dependent oxidoreductase (luciferase family)
MTMIVARPVRPTEAGNLAPVARLGNRRSVTRFGLLLESPVQSRGQSELFETLASLAEATEEAGFDSLWVDDGMRNPPDGLDDDNGGLEAYSLLGALAARTNRIRLGGLPRGEDRRAPSMLAKIVTGVDVISHGRSVATVGSALGGVDGDRLTEALRICRAVLDEQEIEFSGTYYDIRGALNRPRPVQEGGVPLALFVDDDYPLEVGVLTAAVRYVDAVLIGGDGTALGDVAEVVRDASLLHGRTVDSVQVIWVAAQNRSGSETDIETGYFEDRLSAGADGCILSVGTDASAESIRRALIPLRAVMDSMPPRP